MSNKLEEILTNPDSTENFKDKFLGLILDFLEENNYDLNNLDQECGDCKIYDKNMLSSVSGGVNNTLNIVKKAGALGLSALCAVSPAFGTENHSNLKDQATIIHSEKNAESDAKSKKRKSLLNKLDARLLLDIFGWGGFLATGAGLVYTKSKSQNISIDTCKNLNPKEANTASNEPNAKIRELTTALDQKYDEIYAFKGMVKNLLAIPPKKMLKDRLYKLLVPEPETDLCRNKSEIEFVVDLWVLFVNASQGCKLDTHYSKYVLIDLAKMLFHGSDDDILKSIEKRLYELDEAGRDIRTNDIKAGGYAEGLQRERLYMYAKCLFLGLPARETKIINSEDLEKIVRLTQYYGFHDTPIKDEKSGNWNLPRPGWETSFREILDVV